jgi:hypothetical protein
MNDANIDEQFSFFTRFASLSVMLLIFLPILGESEYLIPELKTRLAVGVILSICVMCVAFIPIQNFDQKSSRSRINDLKNVLLIALSLFFFNAFIQKSLTMGEEISSWLSGVAFFLSTVWAIAYYSNPFIIRLFDKGDTKEEMQMKQSLQWSEQTQNILENNLSFDDRLQPILNRFREEVKKRTITEMNRLLPTKANAYSWKLENQLMSALKQVNGLLTQRYNWPKGKEKLLREYLQFHNMEPQVFHSVFQTYMTSLFESRTSFITEREFWTVVRILEGDPLQRKAKERTAHSMPFIHRLVDNHQPQGSSDAFVSRATFLMKLVYAEYRTSRESMNLRIHSSLVRNEIVLKIFDSFDRNSNMTDNRRPLSEMYTEGVDFNLPKTEIIQDIVRVQHHISRIENDLYLPLEESLEEANINEALTDEFIRELFPGYASDA